MGPCFCRDDIAVRPSNTNLNGMKSIVVALMLPVIAANLACSRGAAAQELEHMLPRELGGLYR